MNGFQPNELILAYFFVQRFAYLPVIGCLALLRVLVGGRMARWPALFALLIAAIGVFTAFAPALNIRGPVYVKTAQLMIIGGGLAPICLASGLMLISMILPDRRWRWIDALHLLALTGLVALWIATMF